MPENRPSIPIKTQRAIFVEAGHRCACCGIPFPLERAHIIPWSKSQDHSSKNLICLCANCHEMADRDWDAKTFFAYKANPWVNRQFKPSDIANETVPDNDSLVWYMSTATEVLNHFSELQRLLVENNNSQAEIVMQSLADRARRLYDIGVAIRARTPKLVSVQKQLTD